MLYDTSVYHNIVYSVQNHKLQVNFCFILIYVCCSFNVEYVQLFFSHIGDIFPLVKEYLDVISLCLMCSLHRHIKQSGDLNTCSKFCLYRTDLFRPSQIGALLYLLFFAQASVVLPQNNMGEFPSAPFLSTEIIILAFFGKGNTQHLLRTWPHFRKASAQSMVAILLQSRSPKATCL